MAREDYEIRYDYAGGEWLKRPTGTDGEWVHTTLVDVAEYRELDRSDPGHYVEMLESVTAAAREAECLLMNYLASDKFPAGSDCDEVRTELRDALRALDAGDWPDPPEWIKEASNGQRDQNGRT